MSWVEFLWVELSCGGLARALARAGGLGSGSLSYLLQYQSTPNLPKNASLEPVLVLERQLILTPLWKVYFEIHVNSGNWTRNWDSYVCIKPVISTAEKTLIFFPTKTLFKTKPKK